MIALVFSPTSCRETGWQLITEQAFWFGAEPSRALAIVLSA